MKKELSREEIERRFAEINADEPEEPTAEDLAAIKAAKEDTDTISLTEYKAQKEYSGKLLLRIPKELHQQLAVNAKANGVSINQYALYKLAR